MAVRPIPGAQVGGVDQPFELRGGTNHVWEDLNLTVENTTLYPVAITIFQDGAQWWIRVQPETRHFVTAEDITDLVYQPQRRMITVAQRPGGPRPGEMAEGAAMLREMAIQAGQPELAENAEERVAEWARRAFQIQRPDR